MTRGDDSNINKHSVSGIQGKEEHLVVVRRGKRASTNSSLPYLISMNRRLIFLSLVVFPLVTSQAITVKVTVTNNSPAGGVGLAPFWAGFHNGSFDSYDLGAAAAPALERWAIPAHSVRSSAAMEPWSRPPRCRREHAFKETRASSPKARQRRSCSTWRVMVRMITSPTHP